MSRKMTFEAQGGKVRFGVGHEMSLKVGLK